MISTSLTPPSTDGTESACNVGDPGLIPESGTSLGEGNGTPLQYSCLGNPMEGGLGGYSSWGHKESGMTDRLKPTKLQKCQGHKIQRWKNCQEERRFRT